MNGAVSPLHQFLVTPLPELSFVLIFSVRVGLSVRGSLCIVRFVIGEPSV